MKNFSIQEKEYIHSQEKYKYHVLNFRTSRLILFFDNDTEASTHSYIHKGKIQDKEVKFSNGIRVGMTKNDFINTFFEAFPEELLSKYNQMSLESCVADIRHTYTFTNDTLQSVSFVTDSHWQLD